MRPPRLFITAFLLLACAAAPRAEGPRFAVTGCAHIGRCGHGGYAAAIERMKDYKPDFLLALGGMTEGGTPGEAETACRDYAAASARLGAPVLGVTGGCALSTSAHAGEDCAFALPAGGRAVRELGGALFILLDSRAESDLYAPGQLAFLKAALDGAAPGSKIFVAAHRAPWAYAGRGPSGAAREWMEKVHPLLKGRVSAVFGAGEHFAARRRIDGVLYLLAGVPECLARPGSTHHHFLVVDASGEAPLVRTVAAALPRGAETDADELRPYSEFKFDPLIQALDDFFLSRPLPEGEVRETDMKGRVLGWLDLAPGMQVLDIGAGNGYFTFPIADALKGTGRVVATEIERDWVAALKARAAAGGYRNVEAALVSPEGLDPFYLGRVYDRIFVAGVYDQLPDPAAYFGGLRPALKPGTGRLILVLPKNRVTRPGFNRDELGDMKELVAALRGPFGAYPGLGLSGETMDFIRGRSGADVPYGVRLDLLRRLKLLGMYRYFFPELAAWLAGPGGREEEGIAKAVSLVAPEDRKLVMWLAERAKEQGGFRRGAAAPESFDKAGQQQLNTLLLRSVLGLRRDPEKAASDFRRNYSCPGKEDVISTMRAAGYEFTREFTGTPQYNLEFRRSGK